MEEKTPIYSLEIYQAWTNTQPYMETLRDLFGDEHSHAYPAHIALAGLEETIRSKDEAYAALIADYNQLKEIAHVDNEGTGLANRKAFDNALIQWGRASISLDQLKRVGDDDRQREHKTLLLLDLNNFKLINDVFEWDEGDRILQIVATLLTKSVRESDNVYRYAGDEFAILATRHHTLHSSIVAQAIERRFNKNLQMLRDANNESEWSELIPEHMEYSDVDREAVEVIGASFGSCDLPWGQSLATYDFLVKDTLRAIRAEKEANAVR